MDLTDILTFKINELDQILPNFCCFAYRKSGDTMYISKSWYRRVKYSIQNIRVTAQNLMGKARREFTIDAIDKIDGLLESILEIIHESHSVK
jgi:hypothetical protein